MILQATKTVDADTWNGLIFIVTTLISLLLAFIAYYQKSNADSNKKLVEKMEFIIIDMSIMKVNGAHMTKDVEVIRSEMKYLETNIIDHEKRIYSLEKTK